CCQLPVSSFNSPPPPRIHTLSLHDALPILDGGALPDYGGAQIRQHRRHFRLLDVEPRLVSLQKLGQHGRGVKTRRDHWHAKHVRSEEHTSELQSLRHLVCRLLLEKKKEQTT